MPKKYICFLAAFLCLSLLLCGCGKSDAETSGAPAPVTEVSEVTGFEDAAVEPALSSELPVELTPEPVPTPKEPVTLTMTYEEQDAAALSFMTSAVFQLQASASDGSVGGVWASSDASVASVDENGVVTCWKAGTAKISYSLGDASVSASLSVTEPTVAIQFAGQIKTDISLSAAWGYEIQLVAQVNPAGSEVTWSSDDSSIASVSENGYVTAHKMGSTTIHAKCGTARADCIIRVMDNPPGYLSPTPDPTDNTPRIIITYAGVPNSDLTMTVGSAITMGYVLYNIDPATAKVTWSISDPAYASVDENGVLVALKNTFGPIPGRNYTILKATCGTATCECMVFVKAQ